MQAHWIRRLAGTAGVFAAVVLAASPDRLTAQDPASDAATKALAADVAFLQKGLDKTPEKRAVATLKAAALNVALYGAKDTREQALKVAELIGAKDFAGAKAAAAKLVAGPAKAGDPAKTAEAGKLDLSVVMSAYRPEKVGGMNLEKDIKAQATKASDLKLVEVIAGRSAALAEFTKVLPEGKAAGNAANKKKWEEFSQKQVDASKAVAAEAAKGAAGVGKALKALEATCTACHNEFRD